MKKTLFFAAMLATVCAMTSCVKGSDLELLRHPVHVVGESIDPTFGIPVAYGDLDMNDILQKLGTDYSGYVDPDSTTITLIYEAQFDSTIEVNTSLKKKSMAPATRKGIRSRKDGTDDWVTFKQTQHKSVSIDFFKSVQSYGDIEFDAIWLDITTGVKAEFSDNTMADYVEVSFDSIMLTYLPMDATVPQYKAINDTIVLNNLIVGDTKKFKRIDLSDVVNSAPTAIDVAFRLNFKMSPDYVTLMIENEGFEYWLDTMKVTKFQYDADIKVTMPLSIGIGNMQYDFPVSLGEGIKSINLDSIVKSMNEGLTVDIDSSILTLKMDNGIPLNITLSADLCDAQGHAFNNLFTDETIKAAKLGIDPKDATRWEAIDTTTTNLRVKLDSKQLEDLSKAKTLKLRMAFDSSGKHVDIKREDKLYMKVYLLVDPRLNIDIEVTHSGII
ncbi:MAG: hypothetical protein ACSW8I_04540 [bacterium]